MAAAPKNRVLVGERVSRAGVEAAGSAGLTTEDAVREAVARCDHDAAATRIFARAKRGEAVSAALVAEVLPGLEWWPLACSLIAIGAGDRAGALLATLEQRRFPGTRDTLDIEAIVLFAAHRAGASTARVIPELRRLAARTGTIEGYALLATIAATISDANVTAACKPIAPFAREGAASIAETDRALAGTLEQILAALPAEVEDAAGAGMTVRAAKPPGRNDPCFCGSGNKYKKCCADKELGPASPVAGVSWDAFLTTSADQMTTEHVEELPLRDLARVDLARLGPQPLYSAGERFVRARCWAQAERALGELDGRGGEADVARENLRGLVIHTAFDGKQDELAWKQIALLPAKEREAWKLDLAIAGGPAKAWRALTQAAAALVVSGDRIAAVEFAYSLLRRAPALGVIAARACIGSLAFDDPDTLLEAVEEVRDELNLPPTDPAWTVLDTVIPPKQARKAGRKGAGDDAGGSDEAEAVKLRDSLRDSAARANQLERDLAAMRSELVAATTPTPAELQRRDVAPDSKDRASALESKVADLEALIREGNAERRDLRRALAAAAPDEPAPNAGRGRAEAAAAAAATEAEDALGEAVPVMARPVAIPRFEKRAVAAFGDVPAAVAAEAMRTIGNLAAGDFPAWRGVKQAKDMPTTVLMARVGIHHRLILRSDGGSLEVIDLVTRETLMTTLKRLRANL